MGNSNGYITAPISLHADVYPVLGIAPSGSYYDVAEVCKSGKINEASRNKPMNVNTPTELTETQKQAVFYGHSVPNTTEFINDSKPPQGLTDVWEYVKPTTWCRLTDFDNYDHNVRVVKGDWGVVSIRNPFDTSSAITAGTYITRIDGKELSTNWSANGGRALDIILRDNNPSKTTQVNPYICNMRIAFVVYKSAPSPIPVWEKVKAVVLPLANVGDSDYYQSNVTCEELGYTTDTIKTAELMIKVVAYAYGSTVGDGNDNYTKYSLSFVSGMNVHDVTITSGAWFNAYDLQYDPTITGNVSGLRLRGNLYVTNNIPTQGSSSTQLAPTLSSVVYPYVVFYDANGNILKTFCSANSQATNKVDAVLTSALPEHPSMYQVAAVTYELAKTEFPSTWSYAICSFTGPTITATTVTCPPITIRRNEYTQWS